ncbi:hypothetical protein Thi970DRAFT_00623 [Thiorhodovibrio frisius]|uniref:Uncharacterized protein n=1 Tax=Thiorhodovibrio frisius TaxID=631362 RepID=H8YWZ8_9GAMM|nr:hypothetical protein Thi970DRAFT_00623 [Thiorhodovibrio frisius]WPL22759.1 hypothetical protein Thiofri_02929 [Thiorhodovibrio frisius]
MHGAGDAGVKGVNGAQDLQRLRRVVQLGVVRECRLVGAGDALDIARAGVPGGRDNGLVSPQKAWIAELRSR